VNGSVALAMSGALLTLSENVADVTFALLNSSEGELVEVARVGRGSPAAPERIRLEVGAVPWPLFRAARTQRKERVECGALGLSGGVWPESSREALVVPLLHAGLQGFLVLGLSPRRSRSCAGGCTGSRR
jgi:hypothetical protein